MPRVLRPPPNVNQLQPSSPPFANNTNNNTNNRSNNNSPQLSSNSSVPVSAPRLLPAPPNAQLKPIQPLDKNIGTNGDKNGNGSNANTPSRLSPLPFHDGRRRNHSFSGVFFDRSSAESNDRRYSTILPPSSSVSSPGSAPPPKLSLPSIGASFPAFSNDNAPPAGRRHSITDPSFHAQRRLRPIEPSLLAQSQKLHGMQDPAPPGRRGTVLDLAAAAAHAVSSSTSPKYLDPGPSPLKRRSSFDELSLDGSISSDYPSKRRDSQMSMFSDDRRSSLFNPQLRSQYDADQRRFSYPAGLRAEVAQGERNQDSLKSLAMLSELASASEASSDPKATHQGGRRASMSVVNIATHSDSRQPFPVPPPGASGNTSGGYYQDPFASRRGDTPYSRGPELRVSHKLAERKRRKEMKELFEELRDALPVDKTLKTSKWEILSKAVDYINGLKTDHTNVQAEVEQLRQQVAVLKQGRRMST